MRQGLKPRLRSALAVAVLAVFAMSVPVKATGADTTYFINVGPVPTGVRAGDMQTVMQFVKIGAVDGAPAPGQPVVMEVIAGPDTGQRGAVTTDANGLALWRYSTAAALPSGGTDTVRAWVDLNRNGRFDVGEPSNTNPFFVLPGVNRPPVAGAVSTTTPAGTTVAVQLQGSDPDGRFVGFSIVSRPAHGTLGPLTGSTVNYTPAPGFTGTDSFAYAVRDDGGATAQGRVDITVSGASQAANCDGRSPTLVVPTDAKVAFATGGNDVIVALGSGVTVYALDGDDLVCLGGGENTVYGSGGNDTVHLGDGHNVVHTGAGDDVASAGHGDNRIYGGPGNDRLTAGNGDNTLYGGDGDDHLQVGTGFNTLSGDNANDRLFAAAPGNRMWGGQGDDEFFAPDRSGRH